jgi:hypothetical protein
MKETKPDLTMPGMLLIMMIGYLLIHNLLGSSLFAHSHWDSYTLQAMAWRSGRLGLGQNYTWLELAVYNGDWFVSFPPVPSVFILPLTFLFGASTPSNLVVAVYSMISATLAYKAMRKVGAEGRFAAFWALFTVWGCNLLWMSTNGGVWFQAQSLNMLLCLAAVYCVIQNRRNLSYIFLALAVGCRPFSVCFFPVLFVFYYIKDKELHPELSFYKLALKQLNCLIGPLVIAIAYMLYNYARFGNPLEFGHNYLPEFIVAPDGQFHINYLLTNLGNIFFRLLTVGSDGRLELPRFNGFVFYIANPIYIVWFMCLIRDIFNKGLTLTKKAVVFAVFVNLLLLCLHRTLGGWQFGARYTVDMIPMVFLYLLLSKKTRPAIAEICIGVFAVVFNFYGVFLMSVA